MMKKTIFGIICLALCATVAFSSCAKKEETTNEDVSNDETNIDVVLPVEDEDEEKVLPVFEYRFSGNFATLVAYNGDLEEVVLEENPIRMKKQKETKIITEEVTLDDGTVTTVEKEVEETVEVPVKTFLTDIEPGVFMNNTTVKKIVIPDTVTVIGQACFQGCTALEEVVLPEELETIGNMMFYGCSSLTTLNIPDSVTDIGLFAFGDYFNRTPWYENLTDTSVIVGDGILLKYNGTAPVTYGDEIEKVAYYAFLESKAPSVTFSDYTEIIDTLAFYRSGITVRLPKFSDLTDILKSSGINVEEY